LWQTLQRGTPLGVGRTRFLVAQCGHWMILPVAAIGSSVVCRQEATARREREALAALGRQPSHARWAVELGFEGDAGHGERRSQTRGDGRYPLRVVALDSRLELSAAV
jgi:hypothetical protein